MSTAPSSSTTTTSLGNTATPPQPIGWSHATKVSPATEGGAAVPWHHTGSPVARTPATSRTTPSVTSAATPRFAMRAQRMSPKMPASVMPIASTTAMQPGGIASIAERVEIGFDHEAGVARSSRAGTKRSVNAGPTMRGWPGDSGRVPRIHTLRRPFLSRIVVRVAVVTRESVATAVGSRGIGVAGVPKGDIVPRDSVLRPVSILEDAAQADFTGRRRGLVKRAASGVDFIIASNTYL